MQFDQAIRIVERELLVLREELIAGRSQRWNILLSALVRHWNHRIENIILIEVQRPLATRVETAAAWHHVARHVSGFASPIFTIESPAESCKRVAFGDHWLQAGTDLPRVERMFDVLQTVGAAAPCMNYTRGSIRQTIDWTKRFAARLGIDIVYDDIRSDEGFGLDSVVVADARLDGPERGIQLVSLVAGELVREAHQHSPARHFTALDAALVDCVAYAVILVTGLDPLRNPPPPPDVGRCSIATLTDQLSVVQATSARILEGLQVELCEDLPV